MRSVWQAPRDAAGSARWWRFGAGVLAAAVVGFAPGTPAVAGPVTAGPGYPAADGRCVDTAGVLGAGVCPRVTQVLRGDEAAYPDEIAVAVVPTTGDTAIETWAAGLLTEWGLGRADGDRGVLLVLAVTDGRYRIATGAGVRGQLTDEQAGQIVDGVVAPEARDRRYDLAVLAGLDAVRAALGHPLIGDTLVGPALRSGTPTPGGSGPATGSGVSSATGSGAPGRSPASGDTSGSDLAGFVGLVLLICLVAAIAGGAAYAVRVRRRAGAGRPGAPDDGLPGEGHSGDGD